MFRHSIKWRRKIVEQVLRNRCKEETLIFQDRG